MPRYRFHWRDGTVNEGDGDTPEAAFTALGFGAGAVAALDYHEPVESKECVCQKCGRPGKERIDRGLPLANASCDAW